MHQTDRVLWQFGFRKLIPKVPEVLDKEHKIDLWQTNTNWPVFFLEYIKIWKNRYDYIPAREQIIVPELACPPDYMPWFKIYGKPYMLSEEQRRQQIRVKREQRGPLNTRRRDDSTGPSIAPTQSPGPTPQLTTSTDSSFRLYQAIVARGTARDTIGELISLPIPIALWDSNTSSVGDANSSTFFILSIWVILPIIITRATTTLAGI
ncbi:hypothetical protein CXB51_034157 [Gossypium anomalum]|uniref:Aminotransferase-like plant mobile domain-containing protein n=1 Tax=Gossypium anomalum TaxID=47600 RepID=A0A8J6CGP7_9ROSI|nr:hypothetical protein CXB51_034157 [Gossypium anomalum]